jgi:quercetin dioxygenase-like cupin family protein
MRGQTPCELESRLGHGGHPILMPETAPPRLASPEAVEPGDPARYTGTVRLARLLRAGDDSLRTYEVCFAPESRTVWHVHAGEQMLVALSGHTLVQIADAPARRLAPGEAIRVPGGVRHWHGALAGAPASHLALNVHGPTEWGPPVTPAEFSEAAAFVGQARSRFSNQGS